MVARLYDMETRRDVTAARLLELNPDLLAAGAARADADHARQQTEPEAGPRAPTQTKVDMHHLKADSANPWGTAKNHKGCGLSAVPCGYCPEIEISWGRE